MIREKVKKIVEIHKTNDPFKIAEKIGINVIYGEFERKIKGVYISNENEVIIAINSIFNKNKQKIILAHELGHHFLHNENFNLLRSRDLFPKYSIEEIQANKFASELLIYNADTDSDYIKSLNSYDRKQLLQYRIVDDDDSFYKLCKYLIRGGVKI